MESSRHSIAEYSIAGWIKIIPGSNTGGRVQRDAYELLLSAFAELRK